MEKFAHLLSQKPLFIKSFTPLDFTKLMGNYALEINYTNGEMDMLTTPMPPDIGSDKGNLTEEEYFEFIGVLQKLNL